MLGSREEKTFATVEVIKRENCQAPLYKKKREKNHSKVVKIKTLASIR